MNRLMARAVTDIGLLAMILSLTTLTVVFAQEAPVQSPIDRGRTLVTQRCAICHATGPTGASPRPDAPPLRKLGERYPDPALTEAFDKGLLERHPAMPPFRFSREDLASILAYLHALQEVRGA